MQHPSYLKPLLITTTVFHVLEACFTLVTGLFAVFGLSLLFSDVPAAPYHFPVVMALLVILITLTLPVGFTIAQWMLFHKNRDRAALTVALIGMLPTLYLLIQFVSRILFYAGTNPA